LTLGRVGRTLGGPCDPIEPAAWGSIMLKAFLVLGLLAGTSWTAAAETSPPGPSASSDRGGEFTTATRYLCQKKNSYGYWVTVKVCYCYEDACDWYQHQTSNARIVAQK
jgi:hypothetical protein